MNSQKSSAFCVFEYLYRDAANWKTPGRVLLTGQFCAAHVDAIVEGLESGAFFVAEQVGIPALQRQHLGFYDPIDDEDLDHAFHEFVALRPAEPNELRELPIVGPVTDLVARVGSSANRWDCTLSPFGGRSRSQR